MVTDGDHIYHDEKEKKLPWPFHRCPAQVILPDKGYDYRNRVFQERLFSRIGGWKTGASPHPLPTSPTRCRVRVPLCVSEPGSLLHPLSAAAPQSDSRCT